jgi:hypothetical protein
MSTLVDKYFESIASTLKKGTQISAEIELFLQHHGVVVGLNKVFHWSPKRGFVVTTLREFNGFSGELRVYEYNPNIELPWKKTKRKYKEILHNSKRVESEGNFRIVGKNCEWTATYIKTGRGMCAQMEPMARVITAMIFMIICIVLSIPMKNFIRTILKQSIASIRVTRTAICGPKLVKTIVLDPNSLRCV